MPNRSVDRRAVCYNQYRSRRPRQNPETGHSRLYRSFVAEVSRKRILHSRPFILYASAKSFPKRVMAMSVRAQVSVHEFISLSPNRPVLSPSKVGLQNLVGITHTAARPLLSVATLICQTRKKLPKSKKGKSVPATRTGRITTKQ